MFPSQAWLQELVAVSRHVLSIEASYWCPVSGQFFSLKTPVILRLRPCRRPLWQCGLPNCWLGGLAIFWSAWILAGLLGFCCSVFVLLVLSNAMCASFWMLVSMSVFLALVVASLSPQLLTIALCFKTLSYDRFDGLLRCCFLLSVFLLNLFAEMCAGSLASGCLFSKQFYVRKRKW